MSELSIAKALNPAYRKFKPLRKNVEAFWKELTNCIEDIELSDKNNESEEHIKEPIRQFLKATFYANNFINTKDKIDLAIYLENKTNREVGVIIEAKRPSNKGEFISCDNLNKKALQELLLYYLNERIDCKNNNIKHLIITNGLEWFFFNAENFYDVFYKNTQLKKEYIEFRNGLKDSTKNELFYKEIASKYIESEKDNIQFVHLDLHSKNINKYTDAKLGNIYKTFSNINLLGHSFGNDNNKLNDQFYSELLHIIGLFETKQNSKHVIIRKETKKRDYGSLLENTIFTLEDKNYVDRIKGEQTRESKAFNTGLELCITWINRILFLKLLESQLVKYNESTAYRFLNFDFLDGFDSLNDLFFSALAKPVNDRHPKFKKKFSHIPYLNSSLFERSSIEELTFDITALKDEEMDVYSSTILKKNGKKITGKLNTLNYLFQFLDAFDFSADDSEGIQEGHEYRTLINASVLGLIFEKINGYQDGSFFTPSYITTFMSKEAIRASVINKFKEEYNDKIDDFEDVKSYCSKYFKAKHILKFNETINSLKICDPSVGSGHFLVSSLNEIIAIKSELGILCNSSGERIPCEIQVDNDELFINYEREDSFEYRRNNLHSLNIQRTIFHEKQTIIENCLFGVDINPNSVNICRLRLWIELLKNAYYTASGELQTLPNIDINIKAGNALLSRYALTDSLKSAFNNKDVDVTIQDYKNAVNEYKSTNSKETKKTVTTIIRKIKASCSSTLDKEMNKEISKARGAYEFQEQKIANLKTFNEKINEEDKRTLKKLKHKLEQAQRKKADRQNNVVYQNSFEWRFEFPEILNETADFIGFDLIIGNPPYIQLQKMGQSAKILQTQNYQTYEKTGDIYSLFYELGGKLLKPRGILMFITSNKWMRSGYGKSLRNYLLTDVNPLMLIDFGGIKVFDAATVDTNILMFSKEKNRHNIKACVAKGDALYNLSVFFRQNANKNAFSNSESWVILSDIEHRIKKKIERLGTPLKDWDIQINYGIKTGFNEAFIINEEKRNELIKQDPTSEEIIRPILRGRDIKRYSYEFANLYLIATFPSLNIDIEQYPAVKNHLLSFGKERLEQTGKKHFLNGQEIEARKKTNNKWFETQDSISYWEDFSKQKIMYPNMTKYLPFYLDDKGFLQNDKSFMITGKNIAFLTAFLNSSVFKYCFINNFPDLLGGTRELRKIFLDKIPVLEVSDKTNREFENLVLKLQDLVANLKPTKEVELEIDEKIFDLYSLKEVERKAIGFIEIQ